MGTYVVYTVELAIAIEWVYYISKFQIKRRGEKERNRRSSVLK